ncbi:TIGR03752 family integrating conjugative element protein [Motilimonas eburnea]|uniref:TIGR03752 family integrating conjugative element protein n=1 Tax=Motilimonas eburnea TaxID=1737488 RepID=UPI001E59DFA4|nr:TIGR03752 family integrating conjugative element protein [Motilimonas eburnea]MCE2573848.1 TIGR03752 family integrating conjugative element protein [Motilimonas eburnea]
MASSNNVVPIIVGVAVFGAAAVVMLGGDEKKLTTAKENSIEDIQSSLSEDERALLGATGDTPEDTIRALLRRTELAEKKAQEAVSKVDTLKAENVELKNIEQRMTAFIEDKLKMAESEKQIEITTAKKDDVPYGDPSTIVVPVEKNPSEKEMLAELGLTASTDMPLNLKLPDEVKLPTYNGELSRPAKQNKTSPIIGGLGGDDLMWIEPVDRKVTTDREGNEIVSFPDVKISDIGVLQDIDQSREDLTGIESKKAEKPKPIPHYTIPENATLMASVNMTAIIGRIPMDGTVQDPFPFKILIGKENLATNGIKIPNIDRIVVSGTATGDYTLKCAYGSINSLTYTFNDGTIQTVNTRDSEEETGSLGFISDAQGVPCISGEYISNAPEYLAQKVGVSAFAAAASAYAASQTTNVTSAEGNTTSRVDGDKGKYAAGEALAAGTEATTEWLDARQQNAFDAIFVQLGQKVAVHIQKEIPIDYNPAGRKVSHYASSKNRTRSLD